MEIPSGDSFFHGMLSWISRDAPCDHSFLNVENSPFHWLLIIPPKPVGIWLSTPSVGVTLRHWKVLSGGVQDDSKLEPSNLSPSWSPRKHLCSPSVNCSSLPLWTFLFSCLKRHHPALPCKFFRIGSNTNPCVPSTPGDTCHALLQPAECGLRWKDSALLPALIKGRQNAQHMQLSPQR